MKAVVPSTIPYDLSIHSQAGAPKVASVELSSLVPLASVIVLRSLPTAAVTTYTYPNSQVTVAVSESRETTTGIVTEDNLYIVTESGLALTTESSNASITQANPRASVRRRNS